MQHYFNQHQIDEMPVLEGLLYLQQLFRDLKHIAADRDQLESGPQQDLLQARYFKVFDQIFTAQLDNQYIFRVEGDDIRSIDRGPVSELYWRSRSVMVKMFENDFNLVDIITVFDHYYNQRSKMRNMINAQQQYQTYALLGEEEQEQSELDRLRDNATELQRIYELTSRFDKTSRDFNHHNPDHINLLIDICRNDTLYQSVRQWN